MKFLALCDCHSSFWSPLVRGEWIEIDVSQQIDEIKESPLVRGEWIEMNRMKSYEMPEA